MQYKPNCAAAVGAEMLARSAHTMPTVPSDCNHVNFVGRVFSPSVSHPEIAEAKAAAEAHAKLEAELK